MEAIKIIRKAIDQIEQMNFNGYQINGQNNLIKSVGKDAIATNNVELIKNTLLLISNNIQGFKHFTPYDQTPKICVEAELILKQSYL